MAKPDLQDLKISPKTGRVRRDDGKLGLADTSLNKLPDAANDAAAALLTPAVRIGQLYRNGSVIMVRVA
jgi:hypothetical protein